MTKIRKNVIGAIMCLVMLLVGVCALTACGSKDNASVKFMVQNDNGAWEQYYVSDAKDGKVTMPQNPEKTNYVFRDWYDYSSDPVVFRNEGITSSKTVYAYFVPAEVKISLNGNDSETAKLESLETYTYKYTAEAFKDNLSFDGWYTDQNYTVKYETGADVTELYARFLAHVVFNDGYKTLYEVDIPLGKKLTAPDEVVGKDANNNDVTFEEKTICQIIFMYFVMPMSMSTLPLDDGARFKTWRETFITKIVIAYGTVFSVNIFVLLLPLITRMRIDEISGFGNSMFLIFMIVGGAMVIPAGQALFCKLFGQADDMHAGGNFLRSAFYGSRMVGAATFGLAHKIIHGGASVGKAISNHRKNKADSSGGGDNSDKYSEDKTSAETTEGSESSGGESTE